MNWAAVSPSAGSGGAPNWFVVSITILPASDPACASASGSTLHGTEITTTSPNATAAAGVAALALGPIRAASRASESGSRLKETFS